MDGNGNQPGFSFEPIGRSGGIPLSPGFTQSLRSFAHPFSLPGGPLQIRKACRFTIPLSPGFAPDGRTSTLRLRRGYANKKVKGPSEQAQGPFTFLFAVRAGFEPAVRLPVRQFSKLVVSATHPSHQADPLFPMGLQRYK